METDQEVAQQTPCDQCKYYFGKDSIHCAAHPYGKETKYCNDWQQKHIELEQKNLMANNLEEKNLLVGSFSVVLVGIVGVILLGYGVPKINQSIVDSNNAYKYYDAYIQECDIFLERAGNGGTTGVAEEELAKAVKWLKANYSNQTFEYKDLQGNLNYLKKQPNDSLVPVVIKESIKQNTNTIKTEEQKKRDTGSSGINHIIDLAIIIPLIIFMLIILLGLIFSVINNQQEVE